MEKIVEKILNENPELNIIAIMKVGSQLFRRNPTDLDIEVVIDGYEPKLTRKIHEIDGIKYDVIFKDENFLLDCIENPSNERDIKTDKIPLFNYIYNISENIYGERTYRWQMFSNKEKYLDVIKEIYISGPGKTQNRTFITKFWVHYYMILKIYDNLSYEITDEMLDDVDILYNRPKEALRIIEWIEGRLL